MEMGIRKERGGRKPGKMETLKAQKSKVESLKVKPEKENGKREEQNGCKGN